MSKYIYLTCTTWLGMFFLEWKRPSDVSPSRWRRCYYLPVGSNKAPNVFFHFFLFDKHNFSIIMNGIVFVLDNSRPTVHCFGPLAIFSKWREKIEKDKEKKRKEKKTNMFLYEYIYLLNLWVNVLNYKTLVVFFLQFLLVWSIKRQINLYSYILFQMFNAYQCQLNALQATPYGIKVAFQTPF